MAHERCPETARRRPVGVDGEDGAPAVGADVRRRGAAPVQGDRGRERRERERLVRVDDDGRSADVDERVPCLRRPGDLVQRLGLTQLLGKSGYGRRKSSVEKRIDLVPPRLSFIAEY